MSTCSEKVFTLNEKGNERNGEEGLIYGTEGFCRSSLLPNSLYSTQELHLNWMLLF